MRKRIIATALLFLAIVSMSCGSTPVLPEFTTVVELKTYQQITLEEASDTLGVVLPKPAYLPKGLQIQEVYIYYHPPGNYYPQGKGTVLIIFSDEKVEKELIKYTDQEGIARLKYNIACKMEMQIKWLGGDKFIPIKPPPGLETVKISGRVGFIREKTNVNILVWQIPEFELALFISKDAPKEELIKVAESVKR